MVRLCQEARMSATAPDRDDQDRLIGEEERRRITGLSRTTWWRRERDDPATPKSIYLGPNTIRWRLSEIHAWMDNLPRAEEVQEHTGPRELARQERVEREAERAARPKPQRPTSNDIAARGQRRPRRTRQQILDEARAYCASQQETAT